MYTKIDNYIDRLIAESTPDVPMWNIENIRLGKPANWNYIDGCMITAFLAIGEITSDNKYLDFAERFVDYYISEDGTILRYDKNTYNLDDINEGRVLFALYERTHKEKYRLAIEKLHEQLKEQPRTVTGNFWHKKIYPDQIWLDGIYMAQVFAALYAKKYQNEDYSDVLMQIENVAKYMRDKTTGLYYHGMDCSKSIFWADKETGLSKNFWLRSLGWYSVAMIDIIELTGDETKERLSGIFARLMQDILRYRDEDSKMYWQVVDQGTREGNYLETSGSAMMAYAMLKGARLGILDERYATYGKETFDGICEKYLEINEDGELNLGGICLMAGLGPAEKPKRDGSFEYYISEAIVENDAKGVAPFVLCYTEILRRKGN